MEIQDRNGNSSNSMSRQSSTDNSIESPRDAAEYSKLTDVVDVQVLARMQEDSKWRIVDLGLRSMGVVTLVKSVDLQGCDRGLVGGSF